MAIEWRRTEKKYSLGKATRLPVMWIAKDTETKRDVFSAHYEKARRSWVLTNLKNSQRLLRTSLKDCKCSVEHDMKENGNG